MQLDGEKGHRGGGDHRRGRSGRVVSERNPHEAAELTVDELAPRPGPMTDYRNERPDEWP